MVPTPAQFLNSPDVFQYVSRKVIDNSLSMGLSSRNRTVRAMSLQGLGSTLMHPNKVRGQELERGVLCHPRRVTGKTRHKGSVLKGISLQGLVDRANQAWSALLNCFRRGSELDPLSPPR